VVGGSTEIALDIRPVIWAYLVYLQGCLQRITLGKGRIMIRFVIGLFVFAVALCAYIINAQHGGILPQSQAAAQTTVVTRQEAPVQAEPTQDDTAAQILESIVSRDLGFATASIPVSAAVRDTLAVLGLDLPEGVPSPPDRRFATMIGEALKTGTPDAEIIANIAAKAQSGDVAVPDSLVTAGQKIDTASYLKAVVNTAILATEGADPVVPDLSNDPAAIITANGYDYMIAPSDSLASIAVKFYGDVAQISRLIQANPIALARPDQLTASTIISVPAF
jgi:LysM repeat protein